MGPRPHSLLAVTLTAVADPADGTPRSEADARPRRPSPAARRASAPMAEKTRGYMRNLSASSVGLEMGLAVVLPTLFGIWLDGKLGTTPWMMLLWLCFGFAAGLRGVWRYVAEADRHARESEQERDATAGSTPGGGTPTEATRQRGDDARGGP